MKLASIPYELRILGQGFGAEIGATIAIEHTDDIYTPIHDLFGNIIALLDSEGNPIESYRYNTFGEEKITPYPINSWRYQSKRKIAHLIYFGRRFYDPETGRWLSPDPKGFEEGPNLYQFLRNNPLLQFDFYGEAVSKLQNIKEMESKLSFDLDFEKRCGGPQSFNYTYTPDRDFSNLQDHPLINGTKRIGFIGGVNTTLEEHHENVKTLSRYAGNFPIETTYNATHGLRKDLKECYMGLNLIGTSPALLAADRRENFFANSNPNDLYLETAYSQGAIHAMISMLISPQKHRERTVLLFVAPAAFGTKKISRIAFNFRSVSDPIPSLQKAIGIIGTEGANVTNIEPPPGPFKTHHSFSDPIYKDHVQDVLRRFIGGKFD